MKNVLAIAPETAKHRLSFPVLAESDDPKNREIYLHSNMCKFRRAIKADGSLSSQKESYRILDELIALHRNEL